MKLWIAALLSGGLVCACADKSDLSRQLPGAKPKRAVAAMERVGCAACHEIPGVDWPQGKVGASLAGFAARPMIAGRHPNQPDVLIRWLADAPSLSPTTAMPAMPITPEEARDIAAYLYTLDE